MCSLLSNRVVWRNDHDRSRRSHRPRPHQARGAARVRRKGYEGATIRSIAAAAGVSSGLLRHHFGSKQELRQACDDYLVKTMRDLNAQVQDNAKRGDVHYVSARIRLGQYQDYITRALAEGGAGELFDALVSMTENGLPRPMNIRPGPPMSTPSRAPPSSPRWLLPYRCCGNTSRAAWAWTSAQSRAICGSRPSWSTSIRIRC